MELIALGGPVMWPLLALSMAALAIVIERLLVIRVFRAPKGITALSSASDVRAAVSGLSPLSSFAKALCESGDARRITLAGEEVLARMEKHLSLLAVIAKTSTLLGLLGTILGMIDAFSVIASMTSGVDMTLLASGLWQALITTAAGLVIAIPTYLFLAFFEARVKAMAEFLTLAGNIAAATEKSS